MKSDAKIHSTNNYSLFTWNNENRPVRLNGAKRAALRESMKEHGFLPAYPIYCIRTKEGLVIKDGQHRLAVARELGIAVYYVVLSEDVDIAAINDTQVPWNVNDYAGTYAAQGNKNYMELIEFSQQYRLPLSVCVAILGNNIMERNVMNSFKEGKFRIKSRDLAHRIAKIYGQLVAIDKSLKCRFLIAALFAACQVPEFSETRLIEGANRCPEILKRYGTRDGFLEMIEQLYNFGRRVKFPVKISADNAMRQRNPANKKEEAVEEEPALA